MIIRFLAHIFMVFILTVLTQVGGLIYLLTIPVFKFVGSRVVKKWQSTLVNAFSFLTIYFFFSIVILPFLARQFDRVPLPVFSHNNIKPLSLLTCALNRHYVKRELLETVKISAKEMDEAYPGTVITYLDANFPLMDGFPLLPHLSHNDGKKLDLAFFYFDELNGEPLNRFSPSWHGYGVYEQPEDKEIDTPHFCRSKGYWQYSFIQYTTFRRGPEHASFDANRTKEMIECFIRQKAIKKVFIEPHLKTRLKLNDQKVRFHGCKAVRHDDHIHLQL